MTSGPVNHPDPPLLDTGLCLQMQTQVRFEMGFVLSIPTRLPCLKAVYLFLLERKTQNFV